MYVLFSGECPALTLPHQANNFKTDKPKWDINIWNDEKETAATNAVVVKV